MNEGSTKSQVKPDIGQEELKCDFCEKSFSTKQSLAWHMTNIHENPAAFQCGTCKLTFPKSYQKAHQAIHNVDSEGYKCSICNKGFKNEKYFGHHEARHKKMLYF